ncbi:MAG: glutathione S-transferase family protein [Xenophilus sp.]
MSGMQEKTMQIYSSVVSPFGLRVVLGAKAKGQDVAVLALPEGGVRSETFLRINPLGKIPVLVAGDGRHVAESVAILAYLEHCFPSPALLPGDPAARACMDAACRAVDLYLMTPVCRLFRHLDPNQRDERLVGTEVEQWRIGARRLSALLASAMLPVAAEWSMLDCVLAPSLHLSRRISAMLGLRADPATEEGLGASYVDYAAHPEIGPMLRALTEAQESYDLKAGRPSVAGCH